MRERPIDLREIAGKRYRIEHEESHVGRSDDPWLLVILCRYGHIYPHSEKLLGVATNGRPIGLKLAAISGVTVWQEASDGLNLVFTPDLLPRVAAIVRPRRRRVMTPEQKAIATKRLASFAFRPARQSDRSVENRPQTSAVDTLAV